MMKSGSEKISDVTRHERNHIREVFGEKFPHVTFRLQLLKRNISFKRKEERAGERAVNVRQGDEHEVAARPDVQRIHFHLVPAVGIGRDHEFLVAVFDVLLRIVVAVHELHTVAQGGESAVGAEEQII